MKTKTERKVKGAAASNGTGVVETGNRLNTPPTSPVSQSQPVTTFSVVIPLDKGHDYRGDTLAKTLMDSRSEVGRHVTGTETGTRITGSAKSGREMWEGKRLLPVTTAKGKKALAISRAAIALHRALTGTYSDD
jgi:hypothetical protein